MAKRIQEIIARLRGSTEDDAPEADAFDRLPRMVAMESRRPVRLTPLAVR